ncbi:MAG TPA: hypothetical protein VK509_11560 [Polyangiales bacterium]|nr:hypothetical protein [Polyangiales bacterium]
MVGTKWLAASLLAILGGCIAVPLDGEEDKLRDGAECDENAECHSGSCGLRSKLCAHSMCDCPGDSCDPMGEKSPDCADGWVCAYYEFILGDAAEFFGVERDEDGGYCHPLCEGGCPEHYTCRDGHICTQDPDWADPIATVSWSGGAEGTTSGRSGMATSMLERGASVALSASATSPIDAPIRSYSWTIVESSGMRAPMEGNRIELSLPLESSFMRAELQVLDDVSRSATISVSFDGCSGTGQACGYQGSGCCRSCADATNTCL